MNKNRSIVVVSGPRVYTNSGMVRWGLYRLFYGAETITTIRQGGAQGADALAKQMAALMGLAVEPDWKPQYKAVPGGMDERTWGLVAPLRHTENMLDGVAGPECATANLPADMLVVFRDGPELERGGTHHACAEARKRHIPIIVFETNLEEA